jgi:hypothetical protein
VLLLRDRLVIQVIRRGHGTDPGTDRLAPGALAAAQLLGAEVEIFKFRPAAHPLGLARLDARGRSLAPACDQHDGGHEARGGRRDEQRVGALQESHHEQGDSHHDQQQTSDNHRHDLRSA